MEALGDRLKLMVKVFRRECHRVFHSERTTVHGADGMLMLLQLAMAEVSKQVTVHSQFKQCTHGQTICTSICMQSKPAMCTVASDACASFCKIFQH